MPHAYHGSSTKFPRRGLFLPGDERALRRVRRGPLAAGSPTLDLAADERIELGGARRERAAWTNVSSFGLIGPEYFGFGFISV